MRKPTCNRAQWLWLADRLREGYTAKEIGEFLNLTVANVHRNIRLQTEFNFKTDKQPRDPRLRALEDCRAEFEALRAIPDPPPEGPRYRY